MKDYIKIFYISAIPTILLFMGKANYATSFLESHNLLPSWASKSGIEMLCFILGVLWSSVVVPAQLVKAKNTIEERNATLKTLLAFNKDVWIDNIRKHMNNSNTSLRTRVFVPKTQPLWHRLTKKPINDLVLKEINGVSDPHDAKQLAFKVSPTVEGIVGKAFVDKNLVIECQVDSNKYNLSHYQRTNTADVAFCCAAPIFDTDNKVVAVLSIDSADHCDADAIHTSKFMEAMLFYCSFVNKHTKF